jgi:hypothetical protein
MTRVVALAGVPLLFAAALGMELGHAAPAASRIIDRTMVCLTAPQGGVREVEVEAHGNVIKGPGLVNVASAWVPDMPLAGVGQDIAYFNPRRCKRATARVPLRKRTLDGGPVDRQSGTEIDCETPRRVLVRVRAILRRPTLLRLGTTEFSNQYRLLIARGAVSAGFVAVQTPSGKPLVFATSRRASVRVFTAPDTCFPD